MGELGANHRRGLPLAARSARAPRAARLCHNGAVAGLAGANYYRHRHNGPFPTDAAHHHLTALMTPLSAEPNELAGRLLHRFGSISAISNADEADLRECAVHGEHWVEALLAVRQLLHDGSREEIVRTRLGDDRSSLDRYLIQSIGGLRHERMIAILADEAGFVISEETIAEGQEGQVVLSARRLFGRALALDARQMLIAHNHPSGDATPSNSDIRQTKELLAQAKCLGVTLIDHLVVGRRRVISMRESRLI